jgi:hypothetical protein
MPAMVSLRRRLDHAFDGDRERQFFSHTLQCLATASGQQVEMKDWMITFYEVEFGPKIGSGGLYVHPMSLPAVRSVADSDLTTADKFFWERGMGLKLP